MPSACLVLSGRRPQLLLGLVLSGSLSACSVLPGMPDASAWQPQAAEQRNGIQQWQSAPTSDAVAVLSLQDLLTDDALQQLIEQSLKANPGLAQTLLTLQISQAGLEATRGNQQPSVDAGISASRGEASGTSFGSEVSVSWQLDLWAQLADASKAAAMATARQQALYDSARDTLVAEVMSQWLLLTQLQRALQIQQLLLETLQTNETLILQRYRAGIGSLDELDSARTSLASAEATQADNRYQLAAARRALYNLLGLSASTAPDAIKQLIEADHAGYPEVRLALAGLPAQTLARRPDLQAAWHAIESSALEARVAYKDMLPSLDLGAALTDSSTSLADALFSNPVWSLLAQLTAPLYRGGQLQAALDQAELTTAQNYEAYREALLTAVTEVDNALDLEQSLQQQQDAIERALLTARSNEDRYRQRYRAGLVDLLDLLSVQQTRFSLESQLNSLTWQRLNNRIQLGLALGLPAADTTLPQGNPL